MLLKGMLEWSRSGVPEIRTFAGRWLDFHVNSGRVAPFSGPQSRTVPAGGILITTYTGHFGLAFPCYEMATQLHDERARRVCVNIGKIILHQTKRNHLGMVVHDDAAEFTIPDACYFVVAPLMIASVLDPEYGPVFRYQALYQLRTYIDTFLVKETGLAKTILLKDGLGKSYWTRATGWLLWAIAGVLRHLDARSPEAEPLLHAVNTIAAAVARVQDVSGGLHVFLNDAGSPLETTGTAMCATALHEAIRRNWIPDSYRGTVAQAWSFVRNQITPNGDIRCAYTGWAGSAEQGVIAMDTLAMGWIPGFILSTAYELMSP
jgi:hypothetical protein